MNAKSVSRFALPLCAALLVALAWAGTSGSPLREHSVDARAEQYVASGLKRALTTFAAARTINAILSTAQGTQLAIEPFGVGLQLSVGQALHPINQVVGQFADWMLAASVAFGVMEVLGRIGSSWPLTAGLTLAAAASCGYWWRSRPLPLLLVKTVLILAVVRFAVPVVALGNEWIYASFMASEYATSQDAINVLPRKLDSAADPSAVKRSEAAATGGFVGWLVSMVRPSMSEATKPDGGMVERLKGESTSRIDAVVKAADELTTHVVRLTVVFLLQTLGIPVLVLWVFVRLSAGVLAWLGRGRSA